MMRKFTLLFGVGRHALKFPLFLSLLRFFLSVSFCWQNGKGPAVFASKHSRILNPHMLFPCHVS